ncbi:hypothetical protein [Streptomyces sp. HUAS TT3]|uniref:hypothetical protein n=1 Tax=Streptomyces sp. HUAS TT3 TaxID=3447510 RepID=UPI003F65AAA6
METKRSFGRLLAVSALVLVLEVMLAAVIGVLYALTREPYFKGQYLQAAQAVLTLTCVVAVVALLVSLTVVLPAVALGDLLGRLLGGRNPWGWVPVTVGALLAPLAVAGLAGGMERSTMGVTWAAATAVLSVAALLGRPRREGLFGLVAVRGTAVVVGTGLLGAFGLWTDVLPRYRPPLITAASVVGTWQDETSGSLTFEADGRVTVHGINRFRPGDRHFDPVPRCSGQGTWTFTPGRRNTWGQRVDVDVAGCPLPEWRVAGRAGQLELYHFVGDPDARNLYELRKVR